MHFGGQSSNSGEKNIYYVKENWTLSFYPFFEDICRTAFECSAEVGRVVFIMIGQNVHQTF